MIHLSDIEEEQSGAVDDSFHQEGPRHSIVFSVDSSILESIAAAAAAEDEEDEEEPRRDPLFGSCCDLVRAVIVVDALYIVKSIKMMITILLGLSVTDPDDYNLRWYDDDQIEAIVNQLDKVFWILIIKNICGIIFASIGIYGATRFSKYLVIATIFFCCIDILWSLLFFRWMSALLCVFFIYPHVALFRALSKGKLTRENYHGTKRCCCACCVSCCICCIQDKKMTTTTADPEDPERPRERPSSSGTCTEKSCSGGSIDSKDSRVVPSTESPPYEANSVAAKSA